MNENQYKTYIFAVDAIGGDYASGYHRGLRKFKNGDRFGSAEEHEKWLNADGDLGRGYNDGAKGLPPPGYHGNIGNQHNAKEETLDTGFSGRCLSREKSAWVKAAQNSEHKKLGEWIRSQLNKAAKEQGFE